MWKLILSQDADGSWPASSSTAFSLEARATTETANLKQTLLQRIKETFSSAAEEMDADHGGVAEAVLQGLRGETVDEKGTPRMSVVGPAGLDVNPGDDPLTCSADAILAAMPKRLAAVKAADPTVDVVRVWTTLCCVSSLQRLNVSWIWGDGDTYADPEKTIVDAGRLYVERLAAEKPALAKVLASGAVRQAAKRTTAAWKRANEMRVAELRRGEPMTSQMAISHVHRAGTEMTRALVVGVRSLGGLRAERSGCSTRVLRLCAHLLPRCVLDASRLCSRAARLPAVALHVQCVPLRAAGRPAALAECVACAAFVVCAARLLTRAARHVSQCGPF